MTRKHGVSHVSSRQERREAESRREHKDTDGLGLESQVTETMNCSTDKAMEREETTLPAKESSKSA